MDAVESYRLHSAPLEAAPEGKWQPGGPWSLRGEVALPEDKGKVCGVVALMIPRAGSPCSPPSR